VLGTVIHGDAATELCKLAASPGWDPSVAVIYVDPPWPGCEHIPINGSNDALALWRSVAPLFPLVAHRLIVQLGRNVDPRWMLFAIPDSLVFKTTVTLKMVPPGYRGPVLSGDVAYVYVFGPLRILRPQRSLPGEISSNTPKAAERSGLQHPCPRSLQHALGIVRNYCQRAEVLIDPLAGACTFGVAAEMVGLRSVSIESDEQWVLEGRARLERAAAQLPILPRAVLEQQADLEVGNV
jgi:hypothetical protein